MLSSCFTGYPRDTVCLGYIIVNTLYQCDNMYDDDDDDDNTLYSVTVTVLEICLSRLRHVLKWKMQSFSMCTLWRIRGSGGIDQLIRNLSPSWWWVVNSKPRTLYPRLRTPMLSGWVSPKTGLNLFWRIENSLLVAGNQTPYLPCWIKRDKLDVTCFIISCSTCFGC